ncbi:MAG: hypothetical protein AAFY69_12570 [Pseudomonadota bacterium]
MNRNRILTHLALAFVALTAGAANADTEFLRFERDDSNRIVGLEVAIAHFSSADRDDITVDLIGAVHVGDAAYYADLNERFKDYDAVLYELVAPEGTRVRPGMPRKGMLAGAQLAMTDGLDLAYQLDEIDYFADNLVHADLSGKELRAAMNERGETPLLFAWRGFIAGVKQSARDPMGIQSTIMLANLIAPGDDRTRKITVAKELMKMDQMRELIGQDENSSIIGARNERAIEVLERELAKGHKRVGIFYGVGHNEDFARRLTEDLGFEAEGATWVKAWDIP